jgi:DNA-binding MarR family transcriptional regulator
MDFAADLDAAVLGLYWRISRQTQREMSRSAASVLGTLRDQGPTRITELANAEAVTQPTMTTLVTRLERDGLVARSPDPGDARAVLAEITEEGRERLAGMRAARAAVLDAALQALEPHERAAVEAALPVLEKLSRRTP